MEVQWKSLIERAKNNDQDAFSALYEHSYDAVYRTVKSMVKDEDAAMDIVQDAFISGFAHLDGFEPPENFIPWMRRIATNKARDWFRKRRDITFSQLEDEEDNLPEFEDENLDYAPETVLDRSETARLIEEILGTLSEEQRIAVGMYYYEQMSVAEIAAALGVSENTVKSRLNYGRKKIKAGVEELEKKGTKLYSLSPVPFLLWLFRMQQAQSVAGAGSASMFGNIMSQIGVARPAAPGTAAETAETVADTAKSASSGEAAKAAGTAEGGLLSTLGAKIVVGVLAVALIGGGVAAVVSYVNRDNSVPVLSQGQTETTPTDTAQTLAPETAETTASEEIPEDDTEKIVFLLAGTWKEIQRTDEEVDRYIIINEDGSATTNTGEKWTLQWDYIIRDKDGNTTTKKGTVAIIQTVLENIEPGDKLTIYYMNEARDNKRLEISRYGDSYVMIRGNGPTVYVSNSDENGEYYYYREEDYADYDVVELTSENVADYIEYDGYYATNEDDNGETWVTYYQDPKFKAGLGPHSFVYGTITYKTCYKNITVDPATGEVTVDEMSKKYSESLWSGSVEICAAGDYFQFLVSFNTVKIEGTDPIEDEFSYREVTGAEEIIGKVYVPKGWTP